MTHKTKPDNFDLRFEIVACFAEHDGKMIVLRRHENKSQGGRWGLPAGKVERGEDLKAAVIREIEEETGLRIPEKKIIYFGKTFHRYRDYDFVFHMFSTKFDFLPEVTINSYEHKEYAWKTPSEILAMPKDEIVEDLDEVIKLFYEQ